MLTLILLPPLLVFGAVFLWWAGVGLVALVWSLVDLVVMTATNQTALGALALGLCGALIYFW
jgi:hypothetical protein